MLAMMVRSDKAVVGRPHFTQHGFTDILRNCRRHDGAQLELDRIESQIGVALVLALYGVVAVVDGARAEHNIHCLHEKKYKNGINISDRCLWKP